MVDDDIVSVCQTVSILCPRLELMPLSFRQAFFPKYHFIVIIP